MSSSPPPLQLIQGFSNLPAAAQDKTDRLAKEDGHSKDSPGPIDISCFVSRDGESEWSEQHSAWAKLNPTPFVVAPDPSSTEFLKELADMLAKTQGDDAVTFSQLQILETGFEGTSFHTKIEGGKFQPVWMAFRFESGKMFSSSRQKSYCIDIDLYEDSDISKDWPYRLDEKGIEEKTQFLLFLDVVFLQFKQSSGLRQSFSFKASKQYATFYFEKKEVGELFTRCLDQLVKKSDYVSMRKKYQSKRGRRLSTKSSKA